MHTFLLRKVQLTHLTTKKEYANFLEEINLEGDSVHSIKMIICEDPPKC